MSGDAPIIAIPAAAMAVMALVLATSDQMLLSFLLILIGAGIAQLQRKIEAEPLA